VYIADARHLECVSTSSQGCQDLTPAFAHKTRIHEILDSFILGLASIAKSNLLVAIWAHDTVCFDVHSCNHYRILVDQIAIVSARDTQKMQSSDMRLRILGRQQPPIVARACMNIPALIRARPTTRPLIPIYGRKIEAACIASKIAVKIKSILREPRSCLFFAKRYNSD
jgi:hypothetical protein